MNTSFSSHTICDLRNYLTAAMLLTEELSQENYGEEEYKKSLSDMQNALFSMKELLVLEDR